MTTDDPRPAPRRVSWLKKLLGWLLAVPWFLLRVGVVAWSAFAIWFSPLPWAWLRLALALGFLAVAAWALFTRRTRTKLIAFAAAYAVVLAGWSMIRPSHDREWRPEVSVMPRAFIDGDRVRITGVRNFDYRSRNDFTTRWEEREISFSHLTAVDFYVSYWREGLVGHTFVSFIFDNAPPLSISIETRPQVGRQHALDAGYFSRIEAMSFMLRHDDGQCAQELEQADVVLVGVSRTSKTPTSIYLANRGIKVANVPVVPDRPMPSELDTLDRPLVVGLTISPEPLVQIRMTRLRQLRLEADQRPGARGGFEGNYAELERVRAELPAA